MCKVDEGIVGEIFVFVFEEIGLLWFIEYYYVEVCCEIRLLKCCGKFWLEGGEFCGCGDWFLWCGYGGV